MAVSILNGCCDSYKPHNNRRHLLSVYFTGHWYNFNALAYTAPKTSNLKHIRKLAPTQDISKNVLSKNQYIF